MSVEIRQLKDENGQVFIPLTHWEAVSNKPDIARQSDIPTRTSQLTNDSSFVTEDELASLDLSAYVKNASLEEVSNRIPTLTSQLTNDSSFVTEDDLASLDLSAYVKNASLEEIEYVTALHITDLHNDISTLKADVSTLQEYIINLEQRILILENNSNNG